MHTQASFHNNNNNDKCLEKHCLSVFCYLICAILLFTMLIFENFLSLFVFVSTHVMLFNISNVCTGVLFILFQQVSVKDFCL